jgi:hypothetical protein
MRTMHSIPQIEPGPASHDQARRDGTHLVSCRDGGIRGAINAVSYFQAKAADPNVACMAAAARSHRAWSALVIKSWSTLRSPTSG